MTREPQPQYVKLPFNSKTELDSDLRWGLITSALKDLKIVCELSQTLGLQNMMRRCGDEDALSWSWLRRAIVKYNQNVKDRCNFKIIEEDSGIIWWLVKLLPGIIDHALSLPERLESNIQILEHGQNATIALRRNVICSLLANAFLNTFPKQEATHNLPYFNFWRLFHGENPEENRVKREKLKCILEYFERIGDGNKIPDNKISFSRRHEPKQIDWINCTDELSNMLVKVEERIEDDKGMLQVDFANNMVGGGILAAGAVQEEIRFCINPELIVSRLFTSRLGCDEVLVIKGTKQFSSYSGYSGSFNFRKLNMDESITNKVKEPRDDQGREETQIVAMDAIHFTHDRKLLQYRNDLVNRELHKSYIAFRSDGNNEVNGVSTGNWGCGYYNGDPQLKFLIQWMAASKNEVRINYHAQDYEQRKELISMRNFLTSKKITVGKLYQLLMDYKTSELEWGVRQMRAVQKRSLFEFIEFTLLTTHSQ